MPSSLPLPFPLPPPPLIFFSSSASFFFALLAETSLMQYHSTFRHWFSDVVERVNDDLVPLLTLCFSSTCTSNPQESQSSYLDPLLMTGHMLGQLVIEWAIKFVRRPCLDPRTSTEACLLPLTPIDLSPKESEPNRSRRNDHQILTQSFIVCFRRLPLPGDF